MSGPHPPGRAWSLAHKGLGNADSSETRDRRQRRPGACVQGPLCANAPDRGSLPLPLPFGLPEPQKVAKVPQFPRQQFPGQVPGGLSQSLELVSRMFSHKHVCVASEFGWVFQSPGQRSVALRVTAGPITPKQVMGPGRPEVSGSTKVKVNPHMAGKAAQRARPTDPESAAQTRHWPSREYGPSGLLGEGPADKAGQEPPPR